MSTKSRHFYPFSLRRDRKDVVYVVVVLRAAAKRERRPKRVRVVVVVVVKSSDLSQKTDDVDALFWWWWCASNRWRCDFPLQCRISATWHQPLFDESSAKNVEEHKRKVEAKAAQQMMEKERHQQKFALLFDCGSVLVETEELQIGVRVFCTFRCHGTGAMEWTPHVLRRAGETVGGGNRKCDGIWENVANGHEKR